MKILIISPSNTFPALGGSLGRTNAFLRYLAKQNKIFYVYNKYHQVKDVREGKIKFNIKSKNEFSKIKLYPVGPSIRTIQLFNPFLLIKSYNIIKKEKIDLIIGEFSWSGVYLLSLKFLTGIPYIIDESNIEYEVVRFNYGLIGRILWPFVMLYEKIIWKFSKYVFCVSENDKKTIISRGIDNKKIFVVRNGFDNRFLKTLNKKEMRKKLNLPLNKSIILFFGNLGYNPNKEAVYIIHKEILPRILKKRKDIKFLIIGSNPPRIKCNNIIFMDSMENIENCIYASDIVIAPLLHGAGTRFKIIEAIACGKTVISTSIGANGLEKDNIKDFLVICDDWDDFAEEITKNFSKENERPQKDFLNKYMWDSVTKNINKLIKEK